MAGKLIPFGYAGRNGQARLTALMADPQALLVDIRWYPYSRHYPVFRKDALMQQYGDVLFGGRYHHLTALGNTAFLSEATDISNLPKGLEVLSAYIAQGKTVVLMCVCGNYSTCHRKTVVEELRKLLPELEVVR